MKHLLSLETMPRAAMETVLKASAGFKTGRGGRHAQPLAGQTWALLFAKSSTRTRVSFEVAIRELGGQPMFLNAADIQLGRGEPIKDTARVLGRMVHGTVIRTYAQSDVEEFARYSAIPTVNALTDQEHPCQILTDIFSFEEKRGPIPASIVAFVGDGASNVAQSWIFAAAKLGFELRIAAPNAFQPPRDVLRRAGVREMGTATGRGCGGELENGGRLLVTEHLEQAVAGADLVYTDVWVSMGKEAETATRLQALEPFQVNNALLKFAKPDALVMHCLPAYRGKEISENTFESHASTIFDQAENRLHVQKAILNWIIS
ncbi:MAG: ornithine carbamoyltransferase [Verrucomicrobia bacterium]|nr:ornithine carbamoyltransferase [Verrucomicrobiota bacterium]